jgi:hypothetical protein
MTSHSCSGALVDDAIVRCWNFDTDLSGAAKEDVKGRKERRASIYVVTRRACGAAVVGAWGEL